MKIYLLEHFSECNINGFSSSLDEQGLQDADVIVERLENLDINKIYCSPFVKTMQSIYPFCKKCKKQMNLESTFHDAMYKPINTTIDLYESKNIESHFGYKYLFECVNNYYESKLFASNVPFIETQNEVKNRIFPFLYNLCNRYKSKSKNILIVTHKNIINFIMEFFDKSANCSIDLNEQITEITVYDSWRGLRQSKAPVAYCNV